MNAEHDAAVASDRMAGARRIADSVLYEGYVLFPYRASARKNRFRWQFGVLVPADQAEPGVGVESSLRCECLLDGADARLDVRVRFLHPRRRDVREYDAASARFRPVEQLETGGQLFLAWDEGVEREFGTGELDVTRLLGEEHVRIFDVPGDAEEDAIEDGTGRLVGTVVQTTSPVRAAVTVSARPRPGGVVQLRVSVENRTPWHDADATRDEVLRHSLVGAHLVLVARGGSFLSLLDPPEWAREEAAACENRNTYPVLVGEPGDRDVVLSSPIILYDHPQVAPESVGDSFDATEIDELLSLTVQSLTDEEKRQARATDPRAAAVVDRAEHLPAELLERLHGAIRSVQPAPQRRAGATAADAATPDPAGNDEFAAFFGVGETPREAVAVGSRLVRIGSGVRLRPSRRADAQDLFSTGRRATVRRIVDDVEGVTWVGVTFDDDPGADLHHWYGRFLYFHPDEVEPWTEPGRDT